MTDRDAIVDLINTLFIATDQRDWETVRHCLAPSVHFDMTSLVGGEPAVLTRDQVVAGWEEGLRPILAIHHQAGNYRVGVEGDRVDAFCYGVAYHLLPDGGPARVRTFVGSYDFALARREGAWQIASFRFTCKFVEPPAGRRKCTSGGSASTSSFTGRNTRPTWVRRKSKPSSRGWRRCRG